MKKKNYLILMLIPVLCALLFALFMYLHKDPGNADKDYTEYHFRNAQLLQEHYEKHGIEMGFGSKEEYEKAASAVANDENALHKKEKEDNDDVYYLVDTNELVIISYDGYIRTYFCPDSGKSYFDRQ